VLLCSFRKIYDEKLDPVTGHFIHSIDGGEPTDYSVDPETVGQFTGLYDKNGKQIFEGDILPVYEKDGQNYYYKVIYSGNCFMLSMMDTEQGSYPVPVHSYKCEVIGNVFDNPELIKEGAK
jgi:uncharacterized phage protein (TIGR01671 family)